jgi:drug/metabolite transporter (DMT)-like permease
MAGERLRHTGLYPNLALAGVALAAGFNWMPLRFLARQGLTSAWSGLWTAVIAAIVLVPLSVAQRGPLDGKMLRSLVVTGLINGASMALYIAALLLTDVVRALVLFYLAPMWGVILGMIFLNEKLTRARGIAVALCLAGMLVILGTSHGWPWPRNIGDWLAIGCGFSWAYASVRIYAGPEVSSMTQNLCSMLGCVVVSIAILLLLPAGLAGPPPAASASLLLASAAYALLMVLPINLVALWSAKHLSPARVSLIFAIEAVIGIASAAVLLDEPFGWREALGSALVIGSTLVDVLWHRTPHAPVLPK